MSWVDDNKGQGPWNFTEQPNKWGYLNNPRWVDAPFQPAGNYNNNPEEEPQIWTPEKSSIVVADGSVHHPCGHWHKEKTGEIFLYASIFGNFMKALSTKIDFIAGVYYDGQKRKLSYIGNYKDEDDKSLQALDTYGSDIIAIEGIGASAQILQISSIAINGHFPVVKRFNTLDQYDITGEAGATIIHNTNNVYFITSTTGVLLKHDFTLNNLKRGYYGTCAYSPLDGALYVCNFIPVLGNVWKDVPNGGSNGYWKYIENQTTDSPISIWGADTARAIRSLKTTLLYHNNYIYIAQWQSPYCEAKRINKDDFSIVTGSRAAGGIGSTLAIYEPYVYSSYAGLSNGSILQGSFDTLGVISSQVFSTGSSDIGLSYLIVGKWLIVIRNSAIDVFDPLSFTLISSYPTDQTSCLLLKDNVFVTANNQTISVFEVSDLGFLTKIDTISVNQDDCEGGPMGGCTGLAAHVY